MLSEEINEIVGTIPKWIVRWGMTVIFIVTLLLIIISSRIIYPDVIKSKIIVTQESKRFQSKSELSAVIDSVWVKPNQFVAKNETVLTLLSTANAEKIRELKNSLQTGVIPFNSFLNAELGEVTEDYLSFWKCSMLLEKSKQLANSANGKEVELLKTKLMNSIRLWEERYIIKSRISGYVTYSDFWQTNDQVRMGQSLFIIVNEENSKVRGKMWIPQDNFGKLKKGHKVIVRLKSYPSSDFGLIVGIVDTLPLVFIDSQYLIGISFDKDKLFTSYGREISFNGSLIGEAEIIVDEKSLWNRIFDFPKLSF